VGQEAVPPGRLPTIVEQAAIIAANLPGFGNPMHLTIDIFDDAIAAWRDAQPESGGASDGRRAVDEYMRRHFR